MSQIQVVGTRHQPEIRVVDNDLGAGALSHEELISLGKACIFLKQSITLTGKRIAGKFLGFDDNKPGNDVMVALDHHNKYNFVPTENVVTIYDGWVITD